MQYEDGLIDTSINNNKSQKGDVALIQAQKHCKLASVRLLTPSKARFAYILHSFKSLLMNNDSIEYMYGPIPGVGNEIKTCKPSDEYWEVVHLVVHTMKE